MYQFDKSDFSTDDPIYSSVSSGSRLTPSASLGVFYKKIIILEYLLLMF